MKKVYLGCIFSFKQVWLNKMESLLFLIFFSRVLMFFHVMILKFINDFSKGNIYIYIYIYRKRESKRDVLLNDYCHRK